MLDQVVASELILTDFLAAVALDPLAPIDRDQVVAHAWLSALAHHWPSRATSRQSELLSATARIREAERTRWTRQRRIAIARLARSLSAS